MKEISHLIAGKPITGTRHTQVFNPATGEESARVASGGAGEIDAAVKAARAAFPAWAATPPARRAKVIDEHAAIFILQGALDRLAALNQSSGAG